MNCDEARGTAGRHGQRMRRVGDVDGSGEPLDRRPGQAVPEPVEGANRNVAVDHARTRNAVGREAMSPGAGKQGDGVVAPTVQFGGQRLRELVDVFADTGALVEGRAIIDQNSHGGGARWAQIAASAWSAQGICSGW